MSTTDAEIDALLAGGGHGRVDEQRFVDVGQLQAYRQGRLSQPESEDVERLLLESEKARDLLAELATPVPEAVADWAAAQLAPRAPSAASAGRRWPAYAGGVVALAAALLMFALWPGAADLPTYRLVESAGGIQETRGDLKTSKTYGPDGRVRLTVVPSEERPGTVSAPKVRVFVSAAGSPLRAVTMNVTTRDGAVRLEADARDLFTSPGEKRVWVALAAEEARLDAAGKSAATARSMPGVRWVEVSLRYRDP